MTTESTQLQIPPFPEDIVITDRVADDGCGVLRRALALAVRALKSAPLDVFLRVIPGAASVGR